METYQPHLMIILPQILKYTIMTPESQILFTKNISEQITGNSQLKRKEQIYGIKFHHK